MRRVRITAGLLLGGLLLGAEPLASAAGIRVHGAGLLRDRELLTSLNRLLDADEKESLDANAIEDAAVILSSNLSDSGFQAPLIEIEVQRVDGRKEQYVFDPTFANPLPRPLAAKQVVFRLRPGVRLHISAVEIAGLTAVPVDRAQAFFRTENVLLGRERANAYSPARINRAADSLLGELRQLGYAEAEVRAAVTGEQAGAVSVRVDVREGARWEVAGVRFQHDPAPGVVLPPIAAWLNRPWSPGLEQDLREAVRHAYYEAGYPDVGVHVAAEPEPHAEAVRNAEVVVTIVAGPRVTVGGVRFAGNTVTREPVLRRRVPAEPGDELNPLVFERARYRISRLGVFDAVDLRYDPPEGEKRDAVFTVREGALYETNLLMGYGSYEQLRGGVEYRQMNILGAAHQSRLELVHSLKSTSGEYTYTVPELFGEMLDGTARLFGLQRREIAFLRQEYGATFSLKRPVRQLRGEASAGYTFRALRNRRSSLSTQATDERQINVASMTFALTGDTRDNRLRPRRGYNWSAQAEAADPVLGGESTYQRFEFGAAYHTAWQRGRWVHLGLTHGVLTTLGGASDASLPVNTRFFPGGDNSIRGYQRGEAAPRTEEGRFIGAKSYLLVNLELEQALTPNWSAVIFADALGTTARLANYPYDERLYAAGAGIRFHTLIGPLRVEYARNLNRRPSDPSGTWHFSIGYPF